MRCWKNAKRLSAALSLAVLTACGEPAPPPKSEPAPPPPVLPTAEVPTANDTAPTPALLGWSHESSGEGNALVLREDDTEVVRIACLRGQGLVVRAEGFKHVESEERMSVGAGNTVVTLVATTEGDRMKGEGPIDPDFVRAVAEGRKIAVNYGYQNIGPFNGPPTEVATLFAEGCKDGGG